MDFVIVLLLLLAVAVGTSHLKQLTMGWFPGYPGYWQIL